MALIEIRRTNGTRETVETVELDRADRKAARILLDRDSTVYQYEVVPVTRAELTTWGPAPRIGARL